MAKNPLVNLELCIFFFLLVVFFWAAAYTRRMRSGQTKEATSRVVYIFFLIVFLPIAAFVVLRSMGIVTLSGLELFFGL